MYEAPAKGEFRRAKHTHYVSVTNGIIYPAMQNLPGYEDDNPADWRAATAHEVEMFKQGKQVTPKPAADEVQLAAKPAVIAAPTSIKLADEEPEVDPQDPPQLPADLAAISPAPAFTRD